MGLDGTRREGGGGALHAMGGLCCRSDDAVSCRKRTAERKGGRGACPSSLPPTPPFPKPEATPSGRAVQRAAVMTHSAVQRLRRFSKFGEYRSASNKTNSCEARHQLMHEHRWNYYSNEYTVHGGHEGPQNAHVCKDFFNAILMR